MNKIIKDPTYNIYKRGGNVERKGDEITKDDLKKLADAKKDPDSGLGLELIQNLKQLRDELDPDEKDLKKAEDSSLASQLSFLKKNKKRFANSSAIHEFIRQHR